MKVTTSCIERFHIFDQAEQLQRKKVLHCLIQGYPKFMTRRWGIPDDKVISLLMNGLSARTIRYLPEDLSSTIVPTVHSLFSRRLRHKIPQDTEVFIGLSSFCLDALEYVKSCGITSVVDHGSLHQRTEKRLLEEENRKIGLESNKNTAPEWIINKEDKEFEVADKVMVLSEAAKRSFIEEGVASEKIFVNPCGVNLAQFSPTKKNDSKFRIIFCGSITPRKGLHYLIKAFSELSINDAELWVIGGVLNKKYREYLEKFNLEKVYFMGTFSQSELPRLYSQGSVFILPSIADGFGMVVTQALACGLPVIVSENVGAADVIEEGRNGFVVPVCNANSLKERLEQLYTDVKLREEMSKYAIDNAKFDLSWDGYGDRLFDFLEGINVD